MKLLLFIFFLIAAILSASPNSWVAWDSPEGKSRISCSTAKENFWKLVRFYESQPNLTYCGITSSVIALNALSVEAPPSKTLGKYRMFTVENFFTEKMLALLDKDKIGREGITMSELSAALLTLPVKVQKFEAKSLTDEKIRSLIISTLKNPNQIVLALYQREKIGQEGEGHWSPLAAYDARSDSFLIMDVARFRYPPIWASVSSFIQAMQTVDKDGAPRGFIIIDKELSDGN